MLKNYIWLDFEIIFRKHCKINFARYTKCKTELANLKSRITAGQTEYEDL